MLVMLVDNSTNPQLKYQNTNLQHFVKGNVFVMSAPWNNSLTSYGNETSNVALIELIAYILFPSMVDS